MGIICFCNTCMCMKLCRRCNHSYEVHTGECPCAIGKKICEYPQGCLCREYVEYFKGEENNETKGNN